MKGFSLTGQCDLLSDAYARINGTHILSLISINPVAAEFHSQYKPILLATRPRKTLNSCVKDRRVRVPVCPINAHIDESRLAPVGIIREDIREFLVDLTLVF